MFIILLGRYPHEITRMNLTKEIVNNTIFRPALCVLVQLNIVTIAVLPRIPAQLVAVTVMMMLIACMTLFVERIIVNTLTMQHLNLETAVKM